MRALGQAFSRRSWTLATTAAASSAGWAWPSSIVIAAVEAMLEERFDLNGVQGTTHAAAPLAIISGPICVFPSKGSPTRSDAALAHSRRVNSSTMVSRMAFIECGGNSAGEWAAPGPDVQRTYGMVSGSEWTGVSLALLLAEASMIERERGFSPLLLLDDVLSELDRDRRARLVEAAREHGTHQLVSGDLACNGNAARLELASNVELSGISVDYRARRAAR